MIAVPALMALRMGGRSPLKGIRYSSSSRPPRGAAISIAWSIEAMKSGLFPRASASAFSNVASGMIRMPWPG
jgi:hypothetical protein